jgi:hypothetical protein
MIGYDLDLTFTAGIELNYIQYSEKLKYSSAFFPILPGFEETAVSSNVKVNYLQIPFFGRASFGQKKYKAFITFGPYLGIGTGGSWENAPRSINRGSSVLLDTTYNAKFNTGDFSRVDIGGMVGIGIQYPLGKSGFVFAESRIQIGFTNFYNKLEDDTDRAFATSLYLKPGASWRAANVTVGYRHTFKLPKKTGSAAVKKAGKQKK